MLDYYGMLCEDVRFKEGLHACMNCGICTAVCPAAEFYDYDPRNIATVVQSRDNAAIEKLLKGDTIWFCGECMSCRPRCPRNNTPGYIIQALRSLSQRLGYFAQSRRGLQQIAIKRAVGEHILSTGYCITPANLKPELHVEQGPVWKWIHQNDEEVFGLFTPSYRRAGEGALRQIEADSLAELNQIFEVTGGRELFDTIEKYADERARELGYGGATDEFVMECYRGGDPQE